MNKEKLLTLIHSPYITEKSTSIGSLNQVVFKVDLSASKSEIKKAVEDLFDVKVDSVTTSTQKGKTKRNRFGIYKRSDLIEITPLLPGLVGFALMTAMIN